MNPTRQLHLKKKRRGAIVVPLASMGDIAFLLIIFFILCSTFTQQTSVRLTPPQSPYAEALPDARVSVSIDADGVIFFQGTRVAGPESVELGVAALLESATTDEDRMVVFRCDREVAREVYQPVLEAIASGGGLILAVGDTASSTPK